MIWFLISPLGATIGAIIGIILGTVFGVFSFLIAALPYIFQALIWAVQLVGQFIFYSLIFGYFILKWLAGKIRKAIYSDEYEELHF